MKRKGWVVFLVVMMVFCASISFAQDINIRNRNNNTATATGGNAWQQQQQQQNQNQVQGQTVNTPLQAPLMGAIVGPGGSAVGRWEQLRCNPAYQSFTTEELKNMSDSGRLMDRRGSFWDILFGEKERVVLRGKMSGQKTDQIKILNSVPPIGTKFLGNFACTGDVDWPLDEPLAKCLALAKEKTGTNNVVVWKVDDIDATNSGTAVGAGTGMSNPFGDGSVGAGSLSASFGKTHSMKERVRLVEVHAYEDVVETSNVCGAASAAVIPAVSPAPAAPQAKACDPQSIYDALEKNRIKIYGDGNKKGCDYYCLNNLRLRAERGRLYLDLYKCTGDREALNSAKDNHAIAARNYKFGSDIKKNQAEADKIMAQVYADWAEIEGGK